MIWVMSALSRHAFCVGIGRAGVGPKGLGVHLSVCLIRAAEHILKTPKVCFKIHSFNVEIYSTRSRIWLRVRSSPIAGIADGA
jgi:hypothetical protein